MAAILKRALPGFWPAPNLIKMVALLTGLEPLPPKDAPPAAERFRPSGMPTILDHLGAQLGAVWKIALVAVVWAATGADVLAGAAQPTLEWALKICARDLAITWIVAGLDDFLLCASVGCMNCCPAKRSRQGATGSEGRRSERAERQRVEVRCAWRNHAARGAARELHECRWCNV
jgi:hypothetical protein